MPYSSLDKINPSLKGIKPKITLAQANIIAAWADKIKGDDVKSPWAVAISQFKKAYKVVSGKWVKKEKKDKKKEQSVDGLRGAWVAVSSFMARLFDKAAKGGPEERALGVGRLFQQLDAAVRKMEDLDMPWLHDIFLEDGGTAFAILSAKGRLYQAPIAMQGGVATLGEAVEVEQTFQPTTRTIVREQDDGTYRWLSMSATAVLNKVGEIDPRELFGQFVARAEETGEYPPRRFYHQGASSDIGQTDFLAEEGNVFISSGVFYDSPLAVAVARAHIAEPEAWGDSIGYLPTDEPEMVEVAGGVSVPVFRSGLLEEISSLPEAHAASWFTASYVMEVQRMKQTVRDALEELKVHGLTDDDIEDFVARVDGQNRTIDEQELITRGDGEAEGEPASDEKPPQDRELDPKEESTEIVLDDAALGAIAAKFESLLAPFAERMDGFADTLEQLTRSTEEGAQVASQTVTTLADRVEVLERDDGEKQKEWLADLPRNKQVVVTYRAREAQDGTQDGGNDSEKLTAAAEATLASMPRY